MNLRDALVPYYAQLRERERNPMTYQPEAASNEQPTLIELDAAELGLIYPST